MRAVNLRTTVRTGVLLLVAAAPLRADLMSGETQYKTNPAVSALTPKYTIGLPDYFNVGNQVDSYLSGLTGSGPVGQIFTGTVLSTVYRDPNTGFLTFDYKIDADRSNTRAMLRTVLGGAWDGIEIARVGSDNSGSSGHMDTPEWTDGSPVSIIRGESDEGSQVTFLWRTTSGVGTVLGAGDSSAHMWVETRSNSYAFADVHILGTAVFAEGNIYAPVARVESIPEPGALVLGLIGAAGLGLVRRKRLPA